MFVVVVGVSHCQKRLLATYEFNLKSVSGLKKLSFHCIVSVEQTNDQMKISFPGLIFAQ